MHWRLWHVALLICSLGAARGQDLVPPAAPPPAEAVVETLPPEEVVEAGQRFGGLELGVIRLRLVPGGSSRAGTADFGDNVSVRFATGRTKDNGWSPYLEYSGWDGDIKDGFFHPNSGNVVGRVREARFDLFELGFRSPRYAWGRLGSSADVAVGVPVLNLEQTLARNVQGVPLGTDTRQEFIAGGARAGWLLDVPVSDPLILSARFGTGGYWGGFHTWQDLTHLDNPVDVHFRTFDQRKGGLLWTLSAEAGVTYGFAFKRSICFLSAGYRYELWYSKDLWTFGPLTERKARLEEGGPFLRLEVQY